MCHRLKSWHAVKRPRFFWLQLDPDTTLHSPAARPFQLALKQTKEKKKRGTGSRSLMLTTAKMHTRGDKYVNLRCVRPLYMMHRFRLLTLVCLNMHFFLNLNSVTESQSQSVWITEAIKSNQSFALLTGLSNTAWVCQSLKFPHTHPKHTALHTEKISILGLCCLLNSFQSQVSHICHVCHVIPGNMCSHYPGGRWCLSCWRCCGNISSLWVWQPAAVINGKQQTHKQKHTACIDRTPRCKKCIGEARTNWNADLFWSSVPELLSLWQSAQY